uniref:PIH1_CS domain-containing protein n=1 Tax=Macrostomum lignano TaxID=282301 RepID=A0A1I8FKK2_9PLAT
NRSLTCRHSWDPPQPQAGHAPSVCVLCGNCPGPARPAASIGSTRRIGGVARCLCEPAVRRPAPPAESAPTAWPPPGRCTPVCTPTGAARLHQLVHRRRRPAATCVGFEQAAASTGRSGPAVELCPRLSLQSASKPEVTFCRNQLIAQDELIVCLKDTSTSGLIQVYPEVNVLEKDLEFKSKPQSLDYSVDISFRLSPANLPEDLSLSDAQSSAEQMPATTTLPKSNSYLWQDAGLLAYSCKSYPAERGHNQHRPRPIRLSHNFAAGLAGWFYWLPWRRWRPLPEQRPVNPQAGAVLSRVLPARLSGALPIKPVSAACAASSRLIAAASAISSRVSSEPVEPPAGGLLRLRRDALARGDRPAGGLGRLRRRSAETSARLVPVPSAAKDSGQEREPFDSVRYQLASSVGLRRGKPSISACSPGLLMIELRTSEPTQIRVISSGSVRCHLVTRAASGDSASAQSESESSWQSLLEMLGSIEEKRAPQFQGKGGATRMNDDKAERRAGRERQPERRPALRVHPGAGAHCTVRPLPGSRFRPDGGGDKSLKGHDTVEVVVSGYGESQQRHKVQAACCASELAAAGSQHQRRLFAVPFTEENARQAGGPCDLLEVLDSGVPLKQVLVRGAAGRSYSTGRRWRRCTLGPRIFRSLQRVTGFAETRRTGRCIGVTEVDDKEVSIKSLSVANASATKLHRWRIPRSCCPRFPSPNALGKLEPEIGHKFISNESFLYGPLLPVLPPPDSGRTRPQHGQLAAVRSYQIQRWRRRSCGCFLPQPGRLHRLGLAELGRRQQLRPT